MSGEHQHSLQVFLSEACEIQDGDSGTASTDVTLVLDGGHALRGAVDRVHARDHVVRIWHRVGRQGQRIVKLSNDGYGEDHGTADTPIHVPISKILFAHYSEGSGD